MAHARRSCASPRSSPRRPALRSRGRVSGSRAPRGRRLRCAVCSSSMSGVGASPRATIRSPRRTPAAAAGPPSWTPRTSNPSRCGRPTARRSSRAARGGAIATPSRGRSVAWPLARAAIALGHCGVEVHGEDQPGLHADGVEPEQTALEVEQRRARGPARQRRGVLDRPGDPAPARSAQAAPGARDKAVGDPQATAAGVRHGEDRLAQDGRGRVGGERDRRGVTGLDDEHGKVEVGVEAGNRGRALTGVGEGHRDLIRGRVLRRPPRAPSAGARGRGRRSAPGRARSPPPYRCPTPGPAQRCSGHTGRRRL